MYRFIETIRVEDGRAQLLPYHQLRVNRTLQACGKGRVSICLEDVLGDMLAEAALCKPDYGIRPSPVDALGTLPYKARIIYDDSGKILERSIMPYSMRKIRSLRFVICDEIDYSLKYADRTQLDGLASKSGGADEIIIVRNGLLTDTSYSNIALFDGERWYTPRNPLLYGTMRQYLLNEGLVFESDIAPEAILHYQKVSLINAMMPLGLCCVDTSDIS